MSFIAHTSVRIVAVAMILYYSAAQAELVERDWNEDPGSTAPHCMIYSKTSHFHEYKKNKSVSLPTAIELGVGKLYTGGRRLRINRYFCDRFFSKDPLDRFVARDGGFYWYDKNEFFHESEAVSIDHWRTRYIYSKSTPSYVGSSRCSVFSNDRENNFRWRLMYMPNFKLGAEIGSADKPRIIMIDETGRYLPRGGLPAIGDVRYGYSCGLMDKVGVSCGYGSTHISPISADADGGSLNYNGPIRDISPGFTPMKIESNKVTITRRLSHGEKFWLDDRHEVDVNNFFFYADFDDPIRPVYFAPGVLLRDRPKGYERAPRNEDFINREVCLTDCPSDTEWQLSGIRKRIHSWPLNCLNES